ncbi:serine O-succinyltransferase-like [Gigantopelta aegis]|uniref:serine O-succinyltransferase-like n=1 Tax=Gigantopelta aegis TaxID=1735272 RepID=UPI001B88DC3E|nr:serine O-succinyltransferase-like [Gigantopelta aegis]
MHTFVRKGAILMMKGLKLPAQGESTMCSLTRKHFGTVCAVLQKVKEVPPPVEESLQAPLPQVDLPQVDLPQVDLPQVDMPDYLEVYPEEPQVAFRGLQSDFPCVSRNQKTGPEPEYGNITTGFKLFADKTPFYLKYNKGVLPELNIAYETWGHLNEKRDNAVMIHAGLSASSHAKSHKRNSQPGWWEKFVGPGCAVDTSKFYVICTNNLGGCYGTSGPSSVNPLTGKPYGTSFPIVCVEDMVRAQFLLMDDLGIGKLHGAVGSSLGGMCSLMSAILFPERVGRFVSISSCAQSHPSSIAMRYLQRKCIMSDPNWNKGHYYGGTFPKIGMKLAREIATLTYRSGPEWDERFGRGRINDNDAPSLCPTFDIESYLEYQGENFSTKFDPNSLLYISKAMDLFDAAEGFTSLEAGLARITCPAMVLGVQTDILFPIWQQRELASMLQKAGNEAVTFYELNSLYGHDTFLLDLNGVGAAVKGFLESDMKGFGWLTKERVTKKRKKDKERLYF